MNEALCVSFITNEIFETFKLMDLNKALGIDGLLVCFIKIFWSIIGIDVVSICLN